MSTDTGTHELSPTQLACLEAIRATGDGARGVTASGSIARYLSAHSGPTYLYSEPPWYGTRTLLRPLIRKGLVKEHIVAAKFLKPDEEPPSVTQIPLSLTAAGTQLLSGG